MQRSLHSKVTLRTSSLRRASLWGLRSWQNRSTTASRVSLPHAVHVVASSRMEVLGARRLKLSIVQPRVSRGLLRIVDHPKLSTIRRKIWWRTPYRPFLLTKIVGVQESQSLHARTGSRDANTDMHLTTPVPLDVVGSDAQVPDTSCLSLCCQSTASR